MSNAQHLIENAICCLERGEQEQTFKDRELDNLGNICRDEKFTAEAVLEMFWEAALYVYFDYRLWLMEEFSKEKVGDPDEA